MREGLRMNTRQEHILKELIGKQSPVTGEQLAKFIQVTSRTIRNDIKEIDKLLEMKNAGATITSIRGQGYQLDVTDEVNFKHFIREVVEVDETVPIEPEDRVHYLVKTFLLSSTYLKIET